eukprot:SAG31_NODE_8931_length_1362_cov_0.746635_1_plen_79_part_10
MTYALDGTSITNPPAPIRSVLFFGEMNVSSPGGFAASPSVDSSVKTVAVPSVSITSPIADLRFTVTLTAGVGLVGLAKL